MTVELLWVTKHRFRLKFPGLTYIANLKQNSNFVTPVSSQQKINILAPFVTQLQGTDVSIVTSLSCSLFIIHGFNKVFLIRFSPLMALYYNT